MSYILEALKKADQDRTVGEVPDLEAAHWGVRRRNRPYRWVWIVAILLVINGILLAILLGGRDAPVGIAAPGDPGAAAVPETAGLTERKLATAEVPPPVRRKVPPEARPRIPKPGPLSGQTGVPGAASATPSPGARQAPAGSSRVTTSGVPGWDELSLDFRSTFAPPRLDVHVYADEPARRFILVDLKKYREGDTLQSGAVLEKILPGSIQLNYQGTRFRVDK